MRAAVAVGLVAASLIGVVALAMLIDGVVSLADHCHTWGAPGVQEGPAPADCTVTTGSSLSRTDFLLGLLAVQGVAFAAAVLAIAGAIVPDARALGVAAGLFLIVAGSVILGPFGIPLVIGALLVGQAAWAVRRERRHDGMARTSLVVGAGGALLLLAHLAYAEVALPLLAGVVLLAALAVLHVRALEPPAAPDMP